MKEDDQAATKLNVLVVDDEANIRKTLSYCLAAEGYSVIAVSNSMDAIDEAKRHSFDMAFLDLRLGDEDGMELIPILLAEAPWIKIVVVTAYASIETAVEAMRRGAADYIAKPFLPDQVKLLAGRMARIRNLENQIASLKENIHQIGPQAGFHSQTPGMQRLFETAKKAAVSEATVLIRGESGTGKSVLARAVHQWSTRANKPFGVVSCAAVPPDLLEAELFGHVKGAFTGAVRDNPGRITACEGGTLFLDEIGDITPLVQVKLLRFIQDREYERIGDSTPRRADVRIIAATNADIDRRVVEGLFREDLFYRLNVIDLTVPPLRERPEDIMPLAMDFLAFFARANRKTILAFTDDAAELLCAYSWPGNVRELRNAIERAVILGSGEQIGRVDLPENIAPSSDMPAIGDRISLSTIEELHIRRVLAGASSLQEAADVLGIDQATLWRKRKSYGI
jgi:two-component system, NtrC family, response regulator AlgB